MSCNGCRVLRKRCSDTCTLRSCLEWIDGAEPQAHATAFVAKYFGRAGLASLITSVAENQRAALFRSLFYEACGRIVNPVDGAVGLLCSGHWQICQAAVEMVLNGKTLHPPPPSSSPSKTFQDPFFIHFPLTNPHPHPHPHPHQKLSTLPLLEQTSPDTVNTRSMAHTFRELHQPNKSLKRKHTEADTQKLLASAYPQREVEAYYEAAIYRADMAAPSSAALVLDLTLSSHPLTAYSKRKHKPATAACNSVSSESSVTTAGLAISEVALMQQEQFTLPENRIYDKVH